MISVRHTTRAEPDFAFEGSTDFVMRDQIGTHFINRQFILLELLEQLEGKLGGLQTLNP